MLLSEEPFYSAHINNLVNSPPLGLGGQTKSMMWQRITVKSTYAASYPPEHLQISALLLVHKGSPCLIKRRMRAQPFVLPALWFTMQAIVVLGTAHLGASRRHRIPHLEQHEQNSTRRQRAHILLPRLRNLRHQPRQRQAIAVCRHSYRCGFQHHWRAAGHLLQTSGGLPAGSGGVPYHRYHATKGDEGRTMRGGFHSPDPRTVRHSEYLCAGLQQHPLR